MNTNSNNFRHTPENGDSMLHILICDDDTAFTNTLQSAIAALPDYNRRQMQTICVNDPRVLTKTDIQRADLVFLDIDMGDINGMKLARQMRAIHKDFVLIFVTNYGEYAAEGYEVNAFRFLPKLQLAEKLPSYFRQALAACRSRTRTLNVMCEGEGTNIVLDDLVYTMQNLANEFGVSRLTIYRDLLVLEESYPLRHIHGRAVLPCRKGIT